MAGAESEGGGDEGIKGMIAERPSPYMQTPRFSSMPGSSVSCCVVIRKLCCAFFRVRGGARLFKIADDQRAFLAAAFW